MMSQCFYILSSFVKFVQLTHYKLSKSYWRAAIINVTKTAFLALLSEKVEGLEVHSRFNKQTSANDNSKHEANESSKAQNEVFRAVI